MIALAIIALVIAMFLLLLRAIMSTSSYDRILAGNAFGSVAIATILVLAYDFKLSMFLDIALIYALINFLGTIALLAFVRHGRLDGR